MRCRAYVNMAFVAAGLLTWVVLADFFQWSISASDPRTIVRSSTIISGASLVGSGTWYVYLRATSSGSIPSMEAGILPGLSDLADMA